MPSTTPSWRRFTAASRDDHVSGFVELAFLPVFAFMGTFVRFGSPFRCTYRQFTHCGRSRSSFGISWRLKFIRRSPVFRASVVALLPAVFGSPRPDALPAQTC